MSKRRNHTSYPFVLVFMCAAAFCVWLLAGAGYGLSSDRAIAAALFGFFMAGIIVVHDEPSIKYGALAQIVFGMAAGASCLFVGGADPMLVAVAALLGGVVGFTAPLWMRFVHRL